jgi:hypothetical protein
MTRSSGLCDALSAARLAGEAGQLEREEAHIHKTGKRALRDSDLTSKEHRRGKARVSGRRVRLRGHRAGLRREDGIAVEARSGIEPLYTALQAAA